MSQLIPFIPALLIWPVLLVLHFKKQIRLWFKELFTSRFKIVNWNEGLRPFSLYWRCLGFWILQDRYREFEQARDDIRTIRERPQRGFRIITSYYNKEGEDVN